ncbi:hypothetical protein E3P81_00900 [Wallemia ichthyophaga]|nr:hypothetical protein E3P97_00901 [Wallemia ichthyophaga]TIB34788.1 hypothetical protein E3P85_00755 [Wallemia ichthyophaga]TIB37343.1 hypothetical protein E3P84_00371 [Wallemia ichthyophaga]TIB43841.1 hypothetical protein E3P83_00514 [Wallemia ichthyophaga]TIB49371.1 hypothetical protein E3P82_00898 [Wallemia ichthyophaga]
MDAEAIHSQKKLIEALNGDGSEAGQILHLASSIGDVAWLKSLALSVVCFSFEVQTAIVDEAIAKIDGDHELQERRYRLDTYTLLTSSSQIDEDEDDDPWKDDEDVETAEEQRQPLDLSRFLLSPVQHTSLELAARGEIARLNTFIDRYPSILSDSRYAILEAIPVSIPPTGYLNILPSDESTSNWYISRAIKMDAVGRQLDNALSLIQHGAARGVLGLDRIGEDLVLLLKMAECNHNVGLLEFQEMSYEDSVKAYLAGSSPQDFPTRIKNALLPYLYVLESRNERQTGVTDTELHERLLINIILAVEMDSVLSLIEASRPDLSISERVIKDDKLLVAISLTLLYTTTRTDIIDTIQRVFECMPAWEGGLSCRVRDVTDFTNEGRAEVVQRFKALDVSQLGSLLDHLDIHIESMEILARWSINVTLSRIELCDYEQQLTWARMLTRRSVGTLGENIESGSEWEALLDDMVKLSNSDDGRALGLLERDIVVRIFFSGLLNSAKFELARELLSSPDSLLSSLDRNLVNEIVLETSQEFFDNATDGNINYGYMRLSKEVLEVGAQNARDVNSRKEFILATSRLCSFNLVNVQGVYITPLEVRLEGDKLVFIDQLLSTHRDAYQHPARIMALAEGLDSSLKDNTKRQVEVLGRVIDAAIRYEDYEQAFSVTQTDDYQQKLTFGEDEEDRRWVSFYKLGVEIRWSSVSNRLDCLAQAMRLCPHRRLHDVLSKWKELEESKDRIVPMEKKEGTVKDASGVLASIVRPTTIETQTRHLLSGGLRRLKSVSAGSPGVSSQGMSSSSNSQSHSQPQAHPHQTFGLGLEEKLTRGVGWLIGAEDGWSESKENKDVIPSTNPPQPPLSTTPTLDFFKDLGKADRVYHPFDTYKFVTTLQAYAYSRRVSEIIMVATRTLLIQHALIARSSLMTREDLENSSYLFQAALTELRVELSIRGRADASALRSLTTALTREVDGLEQKMKEDVGGLKDDIELDMNNRKDETQSDGKAFEINVQSLNNRITVATGELRTEVERDKWDTTIRVVGVIFFEAVCIVAAVLLSDPEDVQKKKHKTRLPTAEELGIRETEDEVQQRVI